jgi:hypothetical protein
VGPDTVEILGYQSSNYLFKIISLDAIRPIGFERPDFDSSGFVLGSAPFGGGSGGAPGGQNCPLHDTFQTKWPIGSKLLTRREVFLPEGAVNLRIMVSVDNDLLGAFFDGVSILDRPIIHNECPTWTNFVLMCRQSLLRLDNTF